jgi:hypothetical protein
MYVEACGTFAGISVNGGPAAFEIPKAEVTTPVAACVGGVEDSSEHPPPSTQKGGPPFLRIYSDILSDLTNLKMEFNHPKAAETEEKRKKDSTNGGAYT